MYRCPSNRRLNIGVIPATSQSKSPPPSQRTQELAQEIATQTTEQPAPQSTSTNIPPFIPQETPFSEDKKLYQHAYNGPLNIGVGPPAPQYSSPLTLEQAFEPIPQPSVLSPQPSLLPPQPSLLPPQPSLLSPEPSLLPPQPTSVLIPPLPMQPTPYYLPKPQLPELQPNLLQYASFTTKPNPHQAPQRVQLFAPPLPNPENANFNYSQSYYPSYVLRVPNQLEEKLQELYTLDRQRLSDPVINQFYANLSEARSNIVSLYLSKVGKHTLYHTNMLLIPNVPNEPLLHSTANLFRYKLSRVWMSPESQLIETVHFFMKLDAAKFEMEIKEKLDLILEFNSKVTWDVKDSVMDKLTALAVLFITSGCDVAVNRRVADKIKRCNNDQIADYMRTIQEFHGLYSCALERFPNRIPCICTRCLNKLFKEKEIRKRLERNNRIESILAEI